jgi:hypothetical protein
MTDNLDQARSLIEPITGPLLSFHFSYRVSDEAKRKMEARDERCRRAALYYKDIVFK